MQPKLMLIVIGSALLLGSCGKELTKSRIARIEKAVLEVHGRLVTAAENRDADAMFEYIVDSDDTIIQTGDIVQTRQEAFESIRKSFSRFSRIDYNFTQKQVTVLSPTNAEMITRGQSSNTRNDGTILTTAFTQKISFVLTDDGWKIQYAHHIPENI